MRKVLVKIAKMLRRWLPMIKMEAQEKLEWIIQQVEHEAESPPQIRWRVDMLELAQSDAQLGLAVDRVKL